MMDDLHDWARGPAMAVLDAFGDQQDEIIAGIAIAGICGVFAWLFWLFRHTIRRFFSRFRRPPPETAPFSIAPPPPDFTGRVQDMKAIRRALKPGGTVTIAAVAGMGGVGKTSTARRVAHDLHAQGRFPGGGREINLDGYDRPMDALAALRFLMPGVEGELAQLQEAWRARTVGKDMLILFDNLRDESMLPSIMPGNGPTILVTTREEGFNGAIPLDILTAKEADALIGKLAPRVTDKRERAEIAAIGFHLPLVIDVIAREVERLKTLTVEEALAPFRNVEFLGKTPTDRQQTIAAIFGHSIDALPETDRMDYAALSLFVGGFFEIVAAILWEMEPDAAKRRLADWAARGLVLRADDGPVLGARWRVHDLLGEAGRRHLEAGDAAEMRRRWVGVVLKVLVTADEKYRGEDPLAGLALFDLERGSIEAGQAWAAEHWEADKAAGSDALAQAAMSFPNYHLLITRLASTERLAWLDAGLPAARSLGATDHEAAILGNIGGAAQVAGDFDKARAALEESIALYRRGGDRLREAQGECNLGSLLKDQPDPDLDAAQATYGRSLVLSKTFHDAADPHVARTAKQTSANAHSNIGLVFDLRDDFEKAIVAYRQSIALQPEIGDLLGAANTWFNLSLVLSRRGAKSEARQAAETARDHCHALTMPEDVVKAERQLAHIATLP